MPGIDGFEVAARLRKADDKLPIIMMSGYFERDRVEFSATEAGINAFLQKPVGLDDLEQALAATKNAEGRRPDA